MARGEAEAFWLKRAILCGDHQGEHFWNQMMAQHHHAMNSLQSYTNNQVIFVSLVSPTSNNSKMQLLRPPLCTLSSTANHVASSPSRHHYSILQPLNCFSGEPAPHVWNSPHLPSMPLTPYSGLSHQNNTVSGNTPSQPVCLHPMLSKHSTLFFFHDIVFTMHTIIVFH